MRQAYKRLSPVIGNNVPIILQRLKVCRYCRDDVRSEIEKRVKEIKEAFDGRTGSSDAISVDTSGPGDAPETEGV